jgi:S-methylmethionine-dependent homocysteine/selenocysteine methylase
MPASERIPSLERDKLFIGDGGLETTMIFERGIELPEFASFVLLENDARLDALRDYYRGYIAIAQRHELGFTLDTPTWRANRDWGERLGYSPAELARVNRAAVSLGQQLQAELETAATPIGVCGTIGPRGDAYQPERVMAVPEAQRYHSEQIATLADAGVDMVGAYTLAYAEEAAGIAAAAADHGVPVSISFTVETDGQLPSGQPVGDAITDVDAETDSSTAYFMINCAHPTHVARICEAWLS